MGLQRLTDPVLLYRVFPGRKDHTEYQSEILVCPRTNEQIVCTSFMLPIAYFAQTAA